MREQTDYVGNMIYENNALKRILVDGGYVEDGNYYFYETDHLGNNRVVMNDAGLLVQTNDYYPYGMSFAEGLERSKQPYKYNGKEFDAERGLNLYDYSARFMDPALGRFTTADPLAEKYYSVSPYAYCAGNPINSIDPYGMDIWEINAEGRVIRHIKDKTTDTFYMVEKDGDGNYQRTFTTDSKGNKNYNKISFKYGTIKSKKSYTFSPDKKSVKTFDVYEVRGDGNGTKLFEFMATNTTVEWSQAKTGKAGEKGLNFLTTSHKEGKDYGGTRLYSGQLYAKYTVREMNHSHPRNTAYPSGSFVQKRTNKQVGEWGDVKFSRWIVNHRNKAKLNIPTFNIFLPGKKTYINFGPNSEKKQYGN